MSNTIYVYFPYSLQKNAIKWWILLILISYSHMVYTSYSRLIFTRWIQSLAMNLIFSILYAKISYLHTFWLLLLTSKIKIANIVCPNYSEICWILTCYMFQKVLRRKEFQAMIAMFLKMWDCGLSFWGNCKCIVVLRNLYVAIHNFWLSRSTG